MSYRVHATRETALAVAKEQRRAWHWKRRAAGICPGCGGPHPGRMWYCRACRFKRAKQPEVQP